MSSVRLADSGSFVAFDDEVADVLEDKEVVSAMEGGKGGVSVGCNGIKMKILRMWLIKS